MLNVGQERRLRWGLLAVCLALLVTGAVSTWYWFASRPQPAPPGARLVSGRAAEVI